MVLGKLGELLKERRSDYFSRVQVIYGSAKSTFLPRITPYPFTDHGENHCRRIFANLNALLPDGKKQELTGSEIFTLLCGVIFHDIGYIDWKSKRCKNWKDARRTHNERGREIIIERHKELNLDEGEAHAVGDLCFGHRGENTLNEIEDELAIDPHKPVSMRMRLLASLLRVADELDLSKERAPAVVADLLDLSQENVEHWLKHQIIQTPSIDSRRWRIRIESYPKNLWDLSLLENLESKMNDELMMVKDYFDRFGLYYRKVDIKVFPVYLPKKKEPLFRRLMDEGILLLRPTKFNWDDLLLSSAYDPVAYKLTRLLNEYSKRANVVAVVSNSPVFLAVCRGTRGMVSEIRMYADLQSLKSKSLELADKRVLLVVDEVKDDDEIIEAIKEIRLNGGKLKAVIAWLELSRTLKEELTKYGVDLVSEISYLDIGTE